jgi:hypothetical protein
MADVGLITIKELLRDPQYREYFTKVPKLPDHYTPDMEPWRLLVQLNGDPKWKSKRFGTYKEAFQGFKKLLPKLNNAAINCPGLGFMPPIRNVRLKGKLDQKGQPIPRTIVWRPKLEMDMAAHHWCAHCRRPTIFVDKGMGAKMLNGLRMPATRVAFRCSICGASSDIQDVRHPERNQTWDLNRPRVFELARAA